MKPLTVITVVTVIEAAGLLWAINVVHGANETASKVTVKKAVCVIRPLGKEKVAGTVTFIQESGFILVEAKVTGLPAGLHGFHIHEFGDCSSTDGSSAGGHFNPTNMRHGAPSDAKRHVGDLGNLEANTDGEAIFQWKDRVIRLNGPQSIVGRAIIVHEKEDDLESQPSGNAGNRIACGVIGIGRPE